MRRDFLLALRTAFSLLLVLSCLVAAPLAIGKSHFDKASAEPAEENVKQGILLLRKHDYEGAIDSFKQAIYFARNHYNPEAYKYLGLSYKATRNYGKAIEAFGTFFSQNTDAAPDVRIDLAECYLDIGEFDKARDALDRVMADDGENKVHFRQRYAMGEMDERLAGSSNGHDGKGYLGEAIQFYREALEEKPNYTDAAMAIGRCEVKAGDWNQALQMYHQILEKGPLMHPDLVELYYNMGTCFLRRGDHQGALDHWHMALEQDANHFETHLAIASLLDSEQHYSSARKEYQLALGCATKDNPLQTKIERRIEWIEQQLQPKELPETIKPSPSMRQQFDEPPVNNTAAPKDSGF